MENETTGTDEPQLEPQPQTPAFRREIDLGDGSGAQVFEADSVEALIDKLTDAQRHATAKIRDLSRRVRTAGAQPDLAAKPVALEGRKLTTDEQMLLAQEIQVSPEAAFQKMMRAAIGLTPDELREEIQAVRTERAVQEISRQVDIFLAECPDYEVTTDNGEAMTGYLRERNLALTARNFSLAYEDLSARGLLARTKTAEGYEGRIATEEPKREAQPARSGLSVRDGRTARPQPVSEEAKLARMSTSEMEDYIMRQYGGNR